MHVSEFKILSLSFWVDNLIYVQPSPPPPPPPPFLDGDNDEDRALLLQQLKL